MSLATFSHKTIFEFQPPGPPQGPPGHGAPTGQPGAPPGPHQPLPPQGGPVSLINIYKTPF